jgi:hypothetical protein
MKHTKGEWFADFDGFRTETGISIRANGNFDRQPIGEAYCYEPDSPKGEEAEANAKLIASSPLMLQEHELNLDRMEVLGKALRNGEILNAHAILMAMERSTKAAIKKATE